MSCIHSACTPFPYLFGANKKRNAMHISPISNTRFDAGMYVGCMHQEYTNVLTSAYQKLSPQAIVGSGLSFMVGRLSYTFGFSGPCISTDTACSSSLIATHLAHKV